VPYIATAGELKTKPTQHSVRDLRSIGITPDMLLCRSEQPLDHDIKRKIALFCDVDEEAVITAQDVKSVYEVPLCYQEQGLDTIVLQRLHLPVTEARMDAWTALVERIRNPKDTVTVHFVGKYVEHKDAYKSIIEGLYHGGFKHQLKVDLRFVEAEALEAPGGEALLHGSMGIVVGPGFGGRGSRGMMKAAEYARTTGPAFFGIFYGFQGAVVEFARGVAGLVDADSTEVTEEAPHKVIYKLRDLLGVDDLGGTMRLGSYECRLTPGSLAARLYGADVITERHRHRYEFNCLYEQTLTDKGLRVTGRSTDGKFVEIVEIPGHPCFIAVQVHPEFKSRPSTPQPPFPGFIEATHQRKLPPSAKPRASGWTSPCAASSRLTRKPCRNAQTCLARAMRWAMARSASATTT